MNRVIRGLRRDDLLRIRGRNVEIPHWEALAEAGGFDGGYLEMDDPARRRI